MSEPTLTLKLSVDAVRALARSCHWFRAQLYLAVNGKPHDRSIAMLYEHRDGDHELGIGAVDTMAEMRLDNEKLERLDRKLTDAIEQMRGVHG